MKVYSTDKIKNVVLLGSGGSGKTTLGETILFEGGVISRRGDIDSKNTVSDYHAIEQQNGNSVFSTLLTTEYNNKKINVIDAPGADDYVGSVISSMRPTEAALMIINAANGVEVGTEIQTRYCEKFEKPMVIAVNHLDHDKANWEQTLESLKQSLGSGVVIAQFPVNAGPGFNSIVDVITMKMYKYNGEKGGVEVLDIPADLADQAAEIKNELIEKAAENDEKLMELFFENDGLTEDEMRSGIAAGLINRGMFPVFCISAKNNIGVSRLMEFITNVVPSANEVPLLKTTDDQEIACDASGKTSIFVFKTAVEEHIGEVIFFKVRSGEIKEGMDLVNTSTGNKERISQIFAVAGKTKTKIEKMVAGDVGATVKLKATKTNNTLAEANYDIQYPDVRFPEPKYRVAIKTTTEGDEEKLGEALNKMHEIDPTIIVEYSKELKQIIVHGQGEYHLRMLKWFLDNEYKIDVNYIDPKIPYRETITKKAQADYRHKKQSGGSGQFGEVHMIIEPYTDGMDDPKMIKLGDKDYKLSVRGKEEHDLPWGGKLVFFNCIVGGSIDARFHPAILKGIMEKMDDGPLTGSYARDIRVMIYDGKMHPVDSNEISFKLAGRHAFSEAFKNAGPKIMEPVYNVEVLVPSDLGIGDVMSDLQGRRAIVQGMESEKGFEKVSARVPLAEMNKYSTTLSSITSGRAMFNMTFDEYQQVPMEIQTELIKKFEKENEEE
jgi:elongation factor G